MGLAIRRDFTGEKATLGLEPTGRILTYRMAGEVVQRPWVVRSMLVREIERRLQSGRSRERGPQCLRCDCDLAVQVHVGSAKVVNLIPSTVGSCCTASTRWIYI